MANRQALKELQARLAERLQLAKTQGIAPSWLAVEAAEKKYLFPLDHSGEIFPWVGIQPVSYTQSWFLGVAGLRGGLYGVVDLAGFVDGQASGNRSERARTESRLVSLNSALEVNCVLLIDKLSGLRKQNDFIDFSAPEPDAGVFFGNQYVDRNGASWQEINLQLLAQQVDFLTIAA
ncbi:chemotaxis protein CheW [Polaromonas sp. CG_9.11]|uniref:chemotaxis protein CheW n=1 Tax=Polaromonas sp. CG_9.11 TaxID=2787730 RepID=UPI0018C92764|nr:chemotaxis protein CheW [Polaromonas sp. CG_9.11]MBG6074844.1 twitching motility protein PilI [Polaromonas sp. CG_9.11]